MELLAPAGGWDAFIAAIENGADAVYIGGTNYSARQSAENFNRQQVKEAVEYAHVRGRKVYVTVNTLIDNNEFTEVLDYIFWLHNNGVDAVIVQDLGLMDAIRKTLPSVRVHASTQMTIHNAHGVNYLQEQGVKRIVLARELSRDDLLAIRKKTGNIELEIFVHGALCYCYSGQCLFSSMVGGRSGNRGRCAQPCRLSYDLLRGPKKSRVEMGGNGRHLLSPADLCLLDHLGEIEEAGITSLKIEGRMKRPEYVAVVTRVYRYVLDRLREDPNFKPGEDLKKDLLAIFNRNFTTGYFLPGRPSILSTQRPNNRGVYIGRVLEQDREFRTKIKINTPVIIGDGLEIWVKSGKSPAFVIREMFVGGKSVASAAAGAIVTLKIDGRVMPGDRVFKTHDERIISRAADSIKAELRKKIPVNIEAFLELNKPMTLIFTDKDNNQVTAATAGCAKKALNQALDESTLREKLGRMGNTPFVLEKLILHNPGGLIIPFSEINEARRQGTDKLIKRRLDNNSNIIILRDEFLQRKNIYFQPIPSQTYNRKPLLSVAVSNQLQAMKALQAGAHRVYIGLEGLGTHRKLTRTEMKQLVDYGIEHDQEVVPIIPPICKPADQYFRAELRDRTIKYVMVGNLGALKWGLDQALPLIADYTLNIFNQQTLNLLLNNGVHSACLSPELNLKQLQEFYNFDKVELLVHGELTLMISEQCMLSAAGGGDSSKCTGVCINQKYYIRDDRGFEFPVETDANCRAHIFNSRTLCMMDDLDKIIKLKPASIRIEARRQDENQIYTVVKLYRRALDMLSSSQKPDLSGYKEELLKASGSGFTKCHYYRGVL
ncbi:MAG: DUF3656 domain-containing U32 family peptidase [Syntrophomonadaceae bacterium]|jgi:putative protease